MKRAPIIITLALVVLITVPLLPFACSDANRSLIRGYGDDFDVTLYSGGKAVRRWTSSGKVHSSDCNGSFFFRERNTRRLVEVSGTIAIMTHTE